MNKVINNNEMKDFVGRYFVRVCKNHKIYGVFRKSFYNVMRSRSDRNPFGEFKNIHEMLDKVSDFTEKEYEHHRRTNDKYEKVTMMINHMIHFFLEKGGVNPRRLGAIGQEVFDLSCYGLFGNEFIEDMERMNQTNPRPSNEKEAWLMNEYFRLLSNGEIKMTWDEFKEKYMPQFEANFQNDMMSEDEEDYQYEDNNEDDFLDDIYDDEGFFENDDN